MRMWCTERRPVAHHSSRWLDVLHRVSAQRSQRFILVHEHLFILWRLPDVLLSVPHEHHFLTGGHNISAAAANSPTQTTNRSWFRRRQEAGLRLRSLFLVGGASGMWRVCCSVSARCINNSNISETAHV